MIPMKAKLFLVMLSLGALVLSGCIFEPVEETDPAETTDEGIDPATDPVDTNETDGEEGPSTIPTSVHAAVTATNVSGEAPFKVVFNLSSEAGSARFLDWTFDADDDGTDDKTGYGLPAEAEFTFDEPGNYTARLTVTDAEGRTGNASLDLQVVAPPEVILPDPLTFSGTITGLSDNQGGYLHGGPVEHAFNLTVPVQNISITFETGDTAVDLDFVLYRPDGEEAQARESFNEPTGLAEPRSEPPMLIEDPEHLAVLGAWVLVVHPYISYEGDYTIEVTFA